ncbi:unnamed protein product [Musa textilis]
MPVLIFLVNVDKSCQSTFTFLCKLIDVYLFQFLRSQINQMSCSIDTDSAYKLIKVFLVCSSCNFLVHVGKILIERIPKLFWHTGSAKISLLVNPCTFSITWNRKIIIIKEKKNQSGS